MERRFTRREALALLGSGAAVAALACTESNKDKWQQAKSTEYRIDYPANWYFIPKNQADTKSTDIFTPSPNDLTLERITVEVRGKSEVSLEAFQADFISGTNHIIGTELKIDPKIQHIGPYDPDAYGLNRVAKNLADRYIVQIPQYTQNTIIFASFSKIWKVQHTTTHPELDPKLRILRLMLSTFKEL